MRVRSSREGNRAHEIEVDAARCVNESAEGLLVDWVDQLEGLGEGPSLDFNINITSVSEVGFGDGAGDVVLRGAVHVDGAVGIDDVVGVRNGSVGSGGRGVEVRCEIVEVFGLEDEAHLQ